MSLTPFFEDFDFVLFCLFSKSQSISLFSDLSHIADIYVFPTGNPVFSGVSFYSLQSRERAYVLSLCSVYLRVFCTVLEVVSVSLRNRGKSQNNPYRESPDMSERRRTYKTEKKPEKKYSRITLRISEELEEEIRKNTRESGFQTESDYLRSRISLQDAGRITDAEIQELKSDIIYCREWIDKHKEVLESMISALHLFQKLFS